MGDVYPGIKASMGEKIEIIYNDKNTKRFGSQCTQ